MQQKTVPAREPSAADSERAPAARPIAAGDRLPPSLVARTAAPAADAPQRTSRDALVILLLPVHTAEWTGYLSALDEAAGDIEHWYARIVVIAPTAATATAVGRLALRLTVNADAGAAARVRLGLAPDRAALLIADRYDQVYHVVEAASAGALPAIAEVEQWTRFLATQCPECGVIDQPGHGEWTR
jgi:hypothetical protein